MKNRKCAVKETLGRQPPNKQVSEKPDETSCMTTLYNRFFIISMKEGLVLLLKVDKNVKNHLCNLDTPITLKLLCFIEIMPGDIRGFV